MGKDLKGKELGEGISQRKDGKYTARFLDRNGKRRQKYFDKLQECKRWIETEKYNDKYTGLNAQGDMLYSAFFEYWLYEYKKYSLKESTFELYEAVYRLHIKEFLGDTQLCKITPIQCQSLLNSMAKNGLKSSYIRHTRMVIRSSLGYAVDNDFILKNPCNSTVKANGETSEGIKYFTKEEQIKFLECIAGHKYENHYRFILQTGLRIGELLGLEWEDVDFKNRKISISKNAYYSCKQKKWLYGTPKTKNGIRDIPLTQEAIDVLKDQKKKMIKANVLSKKDAKRCFVSFENGRLQTENTISSCMRYICKKNGLPPLTAHCLRHTFATRCVESGMNPKTLQIILGHENVEFTLNRYVHTTMESKEEGMKLLEEMLTKIC